MQYGKIWTNSDFIYEKVSEYDQEIPQSHTADQPTAREEEPQNIYSNNASVRQ